MKIFYVFRTVRGEKYKKYKEGLEPDHQFYGMVYLKNRGINVSFSDIAYSKYNLLYYLLYPIQYFFIKTTGIGFKIDQAILLIPKLRQMEIIVSTVDSAGLPILLLKALGLIDGRIICLSTGLINEIGRVNNLWLVKLYEFLYKRAERIVCHSQVEIELFKSIFPRLEEKLKFIPFGIDFEYFNQKKLESEYILTIGQDKSRDYDFFARVARKLRRFNFILVTQRDNLKGINLPENVRVIYNIPYKDVKDLYQKASLVFLPLKELNRAEGQISFLEAVATGNNVVISKVKGIYDVYENLQDNKRLYYYNPESLNDAIFGIEKMLNTSIHLLKFPNMYTSTYYGKELEKIIINNEKN